MTLYKSTILKGIADACTKRCCKDTVLYNASLLTTGANKKGYHIMEYGWIKSPHEMKMDELELTRLGRLWKFIWYGRK